MEILCSIGHACGESSREKGRLPFQCARGVCVLPLLILISLETGARRARGWSEARRGAGGFLQHRQELFQIQTISFDSDPNFYLFNSITLSVILRDKKIKIVTNFFCNYIFNMLSGF